MVAKYCLFAIENALAPREAQHAGPQRGHRARRIAGETEASMYAALGLPYLPPQKREQPVASQRFARPRAGTSSTGTEL